MSTVDVRIAPDERGGLSITLNGTEVSHALTAVSFRKDGHGPARMIVELVVLEAPTIAIPANVEIPPGTAAALRALGWTPPAVND